MPEPPPARRRSAGPTSPVSMTGASSAEQRGERRAGYDAEHNTDDGHADTPVLGHAFIVGLPSGLARRGASCEVGRPRGGGAKVSAGRGSTITRLVRPATYVATAFLGLVVLGHRPAAAPDRAKRSGRQLICHRVLHLGLGGHRHRASARSTPPTYWSGFGEVVILATRAARRSRASPPAPRSSPSWSSAGSACVPACTPRPRAATSPSVRWGASSGASPSSRSASRPSSRSCSRCAGGSATTTRSARRPGWASSTPSRPSTTPASPSSPTASMGFAADPLHPAAGLRWRSSSVASACRCSTSSPAGCVDG